MFDGYDTTFKRGGSLVDNKTVSAVARLARLSLSEHEEAAFAAQFTIILNHFREIEAIDTTGIEPLLTPTDIKLKFRTDQVEDLFTPDQILRNAPEKSGHLFKVPPVV